MAIDTTYTLSSGASGLRAEIVDSMVKQIAERAYKFKPCLAIVPTSAWKNTFFREDPTILAGQTGSAIKGIPRGANFPQATVQWQEVSVRIVKHGAEENLIWEDILSNEINIQARTVIKLTEGVVKSVDDEIWNILTNNTLTDSSIVIQSYAITGARYWSAASSAFIKDVFTAKSMISKKYYDTSNLECHVHPDDAVYIMDYLASKGAQFPQIATEVTRAGAIGTIAGITFVENMSVSASYALVLKPKTCGTWKELVPLRSTTIEDPFKSVKIRVVEEGAVELTDPLSVVIIKGTKAP